MTVNHGFRPRPADNPSQELASRPDEWEERFLARIETCETEALRTNQQQLERIKNDLATLQGRRDRVNTGFADGAFDIQEFKELKNPLVARKVEFEQQTKALKAIRANRLEPLKNWVLQANTT